MRSGFVIPSDLRPNQLPPAVDTLLAWATHAKTPYGLIVRSSAPAEDGPHASFAGLYASRFTPAEAAALLATITQVRHSGTSTTTTRAYAEAHRIPVPSRVAAIVQPAIRPYCAGVLTGQLRDDTWATWQIETVHGLADPLVSGHTTGELHHPGQSPTPADQTDMLLPATPAELRLPPGEWITVDDHKGQSSRAKIRTSAGGLVTVLRPPAWKTRPVLSPADRDRLLELAAASAAVIGVTSIDLEWAISPAGALHLLQARPLTRTVPPPCSALPGGAHARGWRGIPASPGCASGPSLNLAAATESATGTVLVCGNIGPDAAAVLLQRLAAIAATTGGPLSHAAIVARELGIPCVTALPKHLLTLPDGTPLTVDGIAGTVHIGTDTHQGAPDPPFAIAGAAVLTWPRPDPHRCDGRAATIIMLEPGTDPATVIGEAADLPGPVGVLQLGDVPLPPLPHQYSELFVPGLGRLGWPHDAGPVPSRLLVLDQTTPIWQRAITTTTPPRRSREL
jgi:pyruvate,water dikinase